MLAWFQTSELLPTTLIFWLLLFSVKTVYLIRAKTYLSCLNCGICTSSWLHKAVPNAKLLPRSEKKCYTQKNMFLLASITSSPGVSKKQGKMHFFRQNESFIKFEKHGLFLESCEKCEWHSSYTAYANITDISVKNYEFLLPASATIAVLPTKWKTLMGHKITLNNV